jgi:heme/copper-type cytochrome/quinol oxidase subunit 4
MKDRPRRDVLSVVAAGLASAELPRIAGDVASGSLWIMANLNANMMPASAIMEMQR